MKTCSCRSLHVKICSYSTFYTWKCFHIALSAQPVHVALYTWKIIHVAPSRYENLFMFLSTRENLFISHFLHMKSFSCRTLNVKICSCRTLYIYSCRILYIIKPVHVCLNIWQSVSTGLCTSQVTTIDFLVFCDTFKSNILEVTFVPDSSPIPGWSYDVCSSDKRWIGRSHGQQVEEAAAAKWIDPEDLRPSFSWTQITPSVSGSMWGRVGSTVPVN